MNTDEQLDNIEARLDRLDAEHDDLLNELAAFRLRLAAIKADTNAMVDELGRAWQL